MTTGVYFIPTNQNGSVATAPPYAHLYATPPPYQVTATPAPVATHAADTLGSTTSIGSVTTPTNTGSTAPFERANRLPPIRPGAGAQGMPTVDVTGNATKKVLPQQDEAGPLPNKVPLTTEFPPSDQPTPTQPSPVRTVSPTPRGLSFDTDVPFEFICPITNEIMKHPVSIADGYTYERRAIKSWLRRNSNSPMTNEPITDTTLRPNDHLRARIEEFVSTHSLV
ncbi:predicted protein [Nematostella vectensis]|uniref:U-box domain-containing protein n=1 Tax=Nematostella vectensis TaxID=45351 RepID=A7S1N7_NEMVE|nr:predicted protein [Nematostella vectensis]|eukprot:XP_001634418.1 predicted protein [Nematostella vectensis]